MHQKQMLVGIGMVVLFAGSLAAWLSMRAEDPEAQIRLVIQDAVNGAEQKQLGDVMDAVSERFEGHGMKRRDLRRFIFGMLHRSRWRRIFIVGTEIDLIDDDTAKVSTGALLSRGDSEVDTVEQAAASTRADTFHFDLDFVKEDGDWKVIGIRYRRADPKALLKEVLP